MCRIAGMYDPRDQHLSESILLMRDSMHRGGPDGANTYIDADFPLALAHRRLAIIELSDAGSQPMCNDDENIIISFNGEIYNYKELRSELQLAGFVFKTLTDTEVIIKAYEQWGTHCFEKFNGMFAIAVWDKRTSEIILARDHAGVKPLYYFSDHQCLYFASEIRAFRSLPVAWKENPYWKILFLGYGHIPAPFTTLSNVFSVPKGSFISFRLPSLNSYKASFFSYQPDYHIYDEATAVALTKEKIEDAVSRQLVSDAPIGVLLSGGLDSSILTMVAAKRKQDIHTVSLFFEEDSFSEKKFQDIIANKSHSNHSAFKVDAPLFLNELPGILAAMDEPTSDGVNAYFISKFVRQCGLKAVLTGVGADELFGGYPSVRRQQYRMNQFIPKFTYQLISNILPEGKWRRFGYLEKQSSPPFKYLFNRGIFSPVSISKILDEDYSTVLSILNSVESASSKLQSKDFAASNDFHIYLQSQLLKDLDCMSMWHGLEARVPFLDKTIVELSKHIAPQVKFNPECSPKHLLIKSFADIIPGNIYNRKKQGFTFPFPIWIKHPDTEAKAFGKSNTNAVRVEGKKSGILRGLKKELQRNTIHWSLYWSYLIQLLKERDPAKTRIPRIRIINLSAFKLTGGIETVSRSLLFAFHNLALQGYCTCTGASLYDRQAKPGYFPNHLYSSYKGRRIIFLWKELIASAKSDYLIVTHVNLASLVFIIKMIHPRKKVILLAHGIEVWQKLSRLKLWLIKNATHIIAVSRYTKAQLINGYQLSGERISVLNNSLDPCLKMPASFIKPGRLIKKYGLSDSDKVLFTLSRLSSTEQYKGYDKVLGVLPDILKTYPSLKFLIAGKADKNESDRLKKMIDKLGIAGSVIFAGYVPQEELTDHYLLADLFIMPSIKEGFGISFIEALFCGVPVIGGNLDGSTDALKQGELGTLINPLDDESIISAILENLKQKQDKQLLSNHSRKYFSPEQYQHQLKMLLQACH